MPEHSPEIKTHRVNPLIEFIQTLENAAVNPIVKKNGTAKGGIIGLEFQYQTEEEQINAKTAVLSKYPQVKILEDEGTTLIVHCLLTGLSTTDSEEMGAKYGKKDNQGWMHW